MKPRSVMTPRHSRRDLFGRAATSYGAPLTDYNYHSGDFGGSSGRYLRIPTQSFWSIAGDYLKDEARHEFWREATLLAFIAVTAAVPLMNNVHALLQFVRATIPF